MAKQHKELIAREGWMFVFPLAALTILSLTMKWSLWLSALFAVMTVLVGYIFRNPYRRIPEDPRAIVAPADGKVIEVSRLEGGNQLVTIFLNLFNVHVNRCPVGGKIERVEHTPGNSRAAFKAKASHENERNKIVIRDGDFVVEAIQIARRIVCWVGESTSVARGERFGLIHFGSRMDVVLPGECELQVKIGQKVAGGSDILALRPRVD